jgi:hypothetical protein
MAKHGVITGISGQFEAVLRGKMPQIRAGRGPEKAWRKMFKYFSKTVDGLAGICHS